MPEKVCSGRAFMERTGGRWTVLSIDFSGESKDIAAKFGNKENRFLCISLNFCVPLVHV